jgi:hypothetical protein
LKLYAGLVRARDLLASNQAKLVGWYSELDEIQFGESFASSKMIATGRSTIDKFLRAYRRGVTDYTEALLRKDRNSKRTADIKSHEAATTIALHVYPDRGPAPRLRSRQAPTLSIRMRNSMSPTSTARSSAHALSLIRFSPGRDFSAATNLSLASLPGS